MGDKKKPKKGYDDGYEAGREQAYRSMLTECLLRLPKSDQNAHGWQLERREAVAALRRLCEAHGDNDWPDNLALSDVISGHLEPYLGD